MPNRQPRGKDTFVIFRVPRNQVGKIRRLVHSQPWYTGDDVPVRSPGRDYLGADQSAVYTAMTEYFDSWKQRAKAFRERQLGSINGEEPQD